MFRQSLPQRGLQGAYGFESLTQFGPLFQLCFQPAAAILGELPIGIGGEQVTQVVGTGVG
jgi:hypothetical protein